MDLVKAIYATGKPVAVVLFNGRPLTANWVADHIPAIVEILVCRGKRADWPFADILLGKVNPSGKLPINFSPARSASCRCIYDHKPTSYHRYVDEVSTPLVSLWTGTQLYGFLEYSGVYRSFRPGIPAGGEKKQRKLSVNHKKNTGGQGRQRKS